ncbi:DMT family transporter [Paenibacillus puldeungensis]|uniref:DMT family transporter n=1 Tax=Paenibacillus puldeungensis TaxID=696536 RepID=A0ABW3S1Q6_9BACL
MAWIAVFIAGCLEVVGVIGMKRLALKKWDGAFYMIISFCISLWLLSYAMRTLPMGTVYGVWTGIGTVGSTLTGMFLYGEPKEWKRLLFISMILGSAVGLKLLS